MQILRATDLIETPWKNGGGITRNIAEGRTPLHSAWRISRADVAQDGAFSNFAGLHRILTVVAGAGMDLVHPGGTLRAALWKPVQFDGGLAVTSRLLDGPLTDFNLMFDPTLCTGTVRVRQGPLAMTMAPSATGTTAIHVLAGKPRLDAQVLDMADTAFLTGPADVTLSKTDAILEIALEARDQSPPITLCIAGQ
ncbi:HutD family protein [Rhodobacteraceae bacterium KMM 6894]|nr:HutD family protein [Rhodobacteraceae bacterium KMM 6894]